MTRACLTIGEDAHVVAIDRTLHESLGVLEDLFLLRSLTEAGVEGELLLLVPITTAWAGCPLFLNPDFERVLVDDGHDWQTSDL